MSVRKVWIVVCVSLVCAALTFGTVAAEKSADRLEGERRGRERATDRAEGEHPGSGRGARRSVRSMGSEAMRAEFERFREAMKVLREESQALRQEIREAVAAAKEGEEKPTQEEIEEIVASYEGEAREIATDMAGERIKHQKKVLSITRKEKSDTIDRITKRLLQLGKGGKGWGDRPEGRKGRGREE